jgi:hypothetical protein
MPGCLHGERKKCADRESLPTSNKNEPLRCCCIVYKTPPRQKKKWWEQEGGTFKQTDNPHLAAHTQKAASTAYSFFLPSLTVLTGAKDDAMMNRSQGVAISHAIHKMQVLLRRKAPKSKLDRRRH